MTKEEWIKEVCEFVNYHDGGHLEPYVALNLADYLVGTLEMLPPPPNVDIITREPHPRGGAILYDWEEPNEEKV